MPAIADVALLITAIAAIITAFIPVVLAHFNNKINKDYQHNSPDTPNIFDHILEDIDTLKKDLYNTIGQANLTHDYLRRDLDELKRMLENEQDSES